MTIDECVALVLDPNADAWITLACQPDFIAAMKERLRSEEVFLDCIDDRAPVTTWRELCDRLDERFLFGSMGDDCLNAWQDYMVEDEYWLEESPILKKGYVICFSQVATFGGNEPDLFRGNEPDLKEYLLHVSRFGWIHRQLLIKIISCE